MFRAAMCPSSGELIVSIWHLVYVTVYRWPFGVQVWTCTPNGHLYRVISILHMFRAAMCPSSGELIVSIRHLVYVTVYRWPFGVQVWTCTPNSHLYRVISILYMFRAAMCPSSGELIVSIQHLVYVTVYRWPFGVQVWTCTPNGHLYRVISILYMFRAAMCPSSGELIVSIHLVYVTVYRWPFGVQVWTCTPNGHLYRVTYTRRHIDTINSPDDGYMAAQNM